MLLCTLHPSLSALAANLEIEDKLDLAVLDQFSARKLNYEQQTDSKFFAVRKTMGGWQAINEDASELSGFQGDNSWLYSGQFLAPELEKIQNTFIKFAQSSAYNCQDTALYSLSQILGFWENLGKEYGKQARARDLRQRVESQLMDWTANFYARLRGKRVLVLTSINPQILASSWINDLIRRIGAIAPEIDPEADQIVVDWQFIAKFEPHVILFAPLGYELKQSCKLFFELEKLPKSDFDLFWNTPAAKRGDLYFCAGDSSFYSLDYRIISMLAVLVSAIASFESGYISERDSFFKLRYLELHRHKI